MRSYRIFYCSRIVELDTLEGSDTVLRIKLRNTWLSTISFIPGDTGVRVKSQSVGELYVFESIVEEPKP